ncbi:hypothetical protein BH24DEI1_BH24DEI1_02380 [soil metagenome]
MWLHPSKLRYRTLEAIMEAERLAERLREARSAHFKLKGGYTLEETKAPIREIREERDYNVWDRVEAELEKEKRAKAEDAHKL